MRSDLPRRLRLAVSAFDAESVGLTEAARLFRVPDDLVAIEADRAFREGRITRKPVRRAKP